MSDLAHDIEVSSEGVIVEKIVDNGVKCVSTTIGDNVTYNGVTRRSGHYHAIDDVSLYDSTALAGVLTKYIVRYLGGARRVVIVGFGNSDYTCDRLGIECIRDIDININERVKVVTIAPLVESVTGISSLDVVRSIVSSVEPDMVIAIDTLATSNITRLGESLQLTDAGINPGSGVANAKGVITCDTLGVPILAIGVPLVISLYNINSRYRGVTRYLVPSNVDSIVDRYAKIIALGINGALDLI